MMRYALTVLLLLLSGPAIADTGRTVLIQSELFYDTQNGIPALGAVNAQIDREFAATIDELRLLEGKLLVAAADLRSAQESGDAGRIASAEARYGNARTSHQVKYESAMVQMERRQHQLAKPIFDKIAAAFPVYASENGIAAIIDPQAGLLFSLPNWTDSGIADLATLENATTHFAAWYRARP